ncbi:unnamed protein product [Leuciscus chuanchicus]
MARTPSAARVMKRKATASVPSLPRRTPSQPAVQQPNQPECGRDTSVGRCGGWNRSRKRRDTGVAGCDRRAAAPGSVHPHGFQELHTELLEAGRELPRLRDYFSNPGNFERQSGTPPACKEQGVGPGGPLIFPLTPAAQVQDRKRRNRDAHTRDRAGSISTLDSLDFARYSDDGNRESDERVAADQTMATASALE